MTDLKFVDQHNMVACLEKTEENAEFHQTVDFLSICLINYALTAVVISESSVRSDLLFNDEDGIACLTNDEIFENLALMGYEQLFTKLTFQKEPFNDTYETPTYSKKVFSNMARKSKKISRRVTPLFDSMLVQNHAPKGEGSTIPPEPQPTPFISQPNVLEPQTESLQTETPPTVSHELQTKAYIEQILLSSSTYQRKQRKTKKHRRAKQFTALPQTSVPLDHGVDEAVYKEGVTTRSERVLEKPNEPPLPEGHTSGSREGSMEHTFELMDTVPPTPHDSPLTGGYTLGSDEGRLKLKELMAICTKLSKQVLDLEKKRDAQAVESSDDDSDAEDASKQGRESDKTKSMFQDSDFDVLDDDMEDVEGETVHTATAGVSAVSAPVTTTGTLIKMKEEKAKEKGVSIQDVEDSPRTIRSITTLQPLLTIDLKDKGKGVLVEEEPGKPVKVKRRDQGLAQIESDAELAQRLHEEELAELDRAQKERQKQEEATSVVLAEEFDEIQARIDADHEMAVRLTHEEQENYIIEERARLLAEFFERRKKQFAAERAKAIRNKPLIRTQIRNKMITYLKHMGKYTHQQLKHKNFEEVQKLYERKKKWIDDFKPIDDDKEDNDAEKEELRDSIDVVPRDDAAIDVESLATKYPIIDWKTHILNENMMYYQIIRADGSSKNYKIFSKMLDNFDRQDVIDLHRVSIHMIIKKKYPLTQEMLSRMLNKRLEVDYESEMAFELLRFTKSQLQK
ncbi:hypothetical protein Tco_1430917 [Tanacetum coccineum]